jgi:hypothetical protein
LIHGSEVANFRRKQSSDDASKLFRKFRTQPRFGWLIGCVLKKEYHPSAQIADPDFLGPGLEIEAPGPGRGTTPPNDRG